MLALTILCCRLSCNAYLLDLKPFLVALSSSTGLARLSLRRGRICHVDVRHWCLVYWCSGGCGDLVEVEAREVERERSWAVSRLWRLKKYFSQLPEQCRVAKCC
ncbi:putative hyperosmotic protein 21 [Alternaria alternata]|nr:putative hyperosmotic protein 21 [Alternaria alternata]